jgi:hypothetical protein
MEEAPEHCDTDEPDSDDRGQVEKKNKKRRITSM